MLRLRCASVLAKATLVLALARVRRLMILQLLFCAKRAAARFICRRVSVLADVCVVFAMRTGDVSIELASVLERSAAAFPVADEFLGA